MQNACQAFLLDRRNFIPFFCSHFPKRTRIEGCIRAKFCHRERRAFLHVIPNQAKGFTRHPEVLHVIPNECEGSPRLLQPVPCEGIPRFADFAPMGLVRRFVEMLLQAGISPRVGRNDSQEQKRAPPLSISPQGKLHLSTAVLASRRSAFCGHSAQPNAAPFTPAAPFSPKSFPMKIFWREVIMT